MSTICGIFTPEASLKPDLNTSGTKMLSLLSSFPHDAKDCYYDKKIFIANTIKHITPESQFEILPRYSNNFNLTITAAAIIDNREELLKEFSIPLTDANNTPDSELILRSYIKWKYDCPNYLVGDYAFAIWDKNNNSLYCARDHVGKQTLYYSYDPECFAFCTIMKPLLVLSNKGLNDEWIADNLATSIPLNQLSTTYTIYKGIHQLPPAHWICVKKDDLKIHRYWNPLRTKKLKLKTNEEYEDAFRRVFFEAVRCRLRSKDSVGILLSSGLDSGSIACIAASMLKIDNKILKSYTSIPIENFMNCLEPDSLADESVYIQSILDQYDNIDAKFSDSYGINSYNSLDRLINLLEFPYKYVQNLFWIDNLMFAAKNDKCSVVLDGQYGNYTVSAGSIENFLCSMISKCKLHKAIKEAKLYSITNNRYFPSVLRHLLLLFIPDRILRLIKCLLRRTIETDKAANPIIHPVLASIWNTDSKLKKYHFEKYIKKNTTIKDVNRFTAEALLLSQSAEAEVKLSLAHGLTRRDPTRDKRVIEFCMSLPEEQLVQQGIERSMIRRAMKDVLPDTIRLNNKARGTQSADWIQRMGGDWQEIKNEFFMALEDIHIKKYIDTKLVRDFIRAQNDGGYETESEIAKIMLSVIAWMRFIKENGKTIPSK